MKYLTIWVSLVTIVAADSFFWWGGGGKSRTLKQRVKNTYPLIEMGSVILAAQRSPCPLPVACSIPPVIQVFRHNCGSTLPYPAFRFSCWRAAWALCKWDQLWGFDCRSEGGWGRRGQKGVQRSQGWWKAGSVAQKKMHWASLQQCFAAVKWSVLYFSEWRFYSVVCRSRLKCTQVRWQISWCA